MGQYKRFKRLKADKLVKAAYPTGAR